MRKLTCVIFLSISLGLISLPAAGPVLVTQLRCEFAKEPLGVDVTAPRLSWQLETSERGQRQTAYQVLVATTPELLARHKGDLWDSGKVRGGQSTLVPYAGKALSSAQQAFWKVRIWDVNGKHTSWSKPATWTMGVLSPGDWQASWVAYSAKVPKPPLLGFHAEPSDTQTEEKWVQVDMGKEHAVTNILLVPMYHHSKQGFGFPHRFKVEASSSADFSRPMTIADFTSADFPSPGTNVLALPCEVTARFVRVTATKQWQRDEAKYAFALCELEVFSNGKNLALDAPVTAKDTVENYGWGKDGLTDGECGVTEVPNREPQTVLMRKEFSVQPGLRRALLNVCGLGCYEFLINGKKAGDALFPPGWTKYDKTCLYDSYDVTPLVREGKNAAGVLLGNGMYNVLGGRYKKFVGTFGQPKIIAQIRLEHEDGSVQVIGTGKDWRVHAGPITFSCVYGGEDYDARMDQPGWSEPSFAETAWREALVVDGPGGALRGLSCSAPPIRAFETLKPIKSTEIKPGVRVFDLGQNVSLMPRLKTRGPAGARVRIIPAELLKADGSVDRQSCGGGNAWWQYTLRGIGDWENYSAKFYYHGARYLQVEAGSPDGAEFPEVQLEGVVVHADCEASGEFECSNELFTRIRTLVRWAQRSNMMSVMTDCPHREKLGWLEENHLNGPSLRYEFNLARLFTKAMNDMADSQHPNGLVPDIAPEYVRFSGGFLDSPEWGSACVLVPWQQYLFHGDIELLRRYYPVMEAYVAYLGSKASNNIVSHGLGDWYDIGPKPPGYAQLTPIPLTATAFYYYDAWVLCEAAKLLGQPEKAKKYFLLADEIKAAFNREFLVKDKQHYAGNSQAGNAIALDMGLAPLEVRPALIESIVADVKSRGNALSAGDVGYRYLLRALADAGRSDVIFAMNNQSEKPGYGFQLRQGATSLTEAWDARPQSSHNHFMLGQITEWFYHDLAGIQPCLEQPGFKKVRFKPSLVDGVTWARASHHNDFGLVSTHWEKKDGNFRMRITVPPNAIGEVHIPGRELSSIRESEKPATKAKAVKFLREQDGRFVFLVESGSYEFESGL